MRGRGGVRFMVFSLESCLASDVFEMVCQKLIFVVFPICCVPDPEPLPKLL